MWVNAGRLRHLLEPSSYYEADAYDREVSRLFAPGWHFVGTRDDLDAHGAFSTLDLFGQPVLVRNHQGEHHAYLNVCAHRHALLTSQPRGQSDALRCQYHGWEYAPDGTPCRVRDPHCFQPVGRGAERLRKLAVACCGRLMFVSLADHPPSLQTYLGPATWRLASEIFADAYVQIDARSIEHPANWKIPIENVLESYHVPVVHGGSFGAIPSKPSQRHELGEGYSEYEDVEPPSSRLYRFAMWSVREAPRYHYRHHHCFPNLTFVHTDASSYVQSVAPTSATTSVSHVRLFAYRDARHAARRLVASVLRTPLVRFTEKVLSEDARLVGDVQRGMRASRHRGVLGASEERVFAFQAWVRRHAHESTVGPLADVEGRALGASTFAGEAVAGFSAERRWPAERAAPIETSRVTPPLDHPAA